MPFGDREQQRLVEPGLDRRAHSLSSAQSRIDFWAWTRFSASSQTREAGPSITASTTSSPRCAGRQWRKSASPFALALNLSSTRDRKRVVSGKRVSVSVDLGGRRFVKKKKNK